MVAPGFIVVESRRSAHYGGFHRVGEGRWPGFSLKMPWE